MKVCNSSARLLGSAGTAALLLGLTQPVFADSIETVVVTASRIDATEVKKQSPNVVDAYSAEQIRQLPDANAAEALQRVPGIQLETDTGEGRFINIRGLDADLNGTTYGGVKLLASNPSTPQSGARAVAFDAFPAGILGGVEVFKSLTPEMDAEGLGGVVNIVPRSLPAGKERFLDASIGGGFESLRGFPVYKGDITAGTRFFNDKMSVVFSYGYEQDHRGIDDVEEDYAYNPGNDGVDLPGTPTARQANKEFDNLQYRWYQYHRQRQGYGATWTWDIDNTTSVYLRGLHAGYTEIANKHEFILKNLGHNIASVTPGLSYDATQASLNYSDIYTKETLGNDVIALGGNTLLGNIVKADARISWTEGFDQFPISISAKFAAPSADVVYNNNDPDHPAISSATNLVNPALWSLTKKASSSFNEHLDQEYAVVANFSFPWSIVGEGGTVKFGGSARERTRGANASLASSPVTIGQPLANFVSGPDVVYYHGYFDIGPQPNYTLLPQIPFKPFALDPSAYEHDNENVYAGYVQYSTSFGKLDVIGGVRIEATGATYRANDVDGDGNFLALHVTPTSYTNVFPDVSAKYQWSDALQFRAAFTTAIARPGFNELTAARTIDVSGSPILVSTGNPNLKPTTGSNFDLSAAYFLPHGGIASVGLFYKAFSNYIIGTQKNTTAYPGFVGQQVTLSSFANIGDADAEGVELQYTQQFDFLPGAFSGLGFDGNMTYVSSNGLVHPTDTKKSQLPQTSPFAYNAGVFYNYGPVYAKLAAAYVSTNLWAVGSDPTVDTYSQPRFRLDFGGSYDITGQLQVYVDVKNITNTHLHFTYTKSKDLPIQNEFYDQDYLMGVRVRL